MQWNPGQSPVRMPFPGFRFASSGLQRIECIETTVSLLFGNYSGGSNMLIYNKNVNILVTYQSNDVRK